MKKLAPLISLLGFLALAILFHVERNYVAAGIVAVVFLILSYAVKELRPYLKIFAVVVLMWAVFYLDRQGAYLLDWPHDFFIVALLGYLVLRFGFKHRADRLKWSLKFSKKEWLSVFIINVPAIFVLLIYFFNHIEVANTFPQIPGPPWAVPAVIVAGALLNGLREEIYYRALVLPLSLKMAPVWFAVTLQAILFGFLHFSHSFPQGWWGVVLTGTWGAMISIQYVIFRSISLSWITHSVADAIMFTIILISRS